ncbi:flagellar hook-basal body complex protein FliE [Syntrophotalea carbinolica DSM 2380]|uniref:Flagellar hook-basal body complex protein FliE n=1 Tax=Syntrophotalea carbinolica (strain DSM 2380 / NBRC 103641 / GraBd1) TaxID=338963 RepID=Q3A5B5_SYNC1|nr:flagellar hook-basal body complex protein FliE [Syntrophotalea carbinolica]ABA88442.1 flagellar hook-basal body complex protein FliE [Syntrophotalea carbinolica DSM 2380]
MKNIGAISQPLQTAIKAGGEAQTKKTGNSFGDLLAEAIDEVGKTQAQADQAIEKLQTGESRNIHEVMIAMEKAGISMRLMVQMRNKVVEAYQEIMRMQI